MSSTPDHTTTNLSTIVVEKTKLIRTLTENRSSHKEIYDAACEGFWIQAKEKLEKRKGQFAAATEKASKSFEEQFAAFQQALNDQKKDALSPFDSGGHTPYGADKWTLDVSTNWVPAYPTNHLDEYDRAIQMLDFSVADKVTLSLSEFEAYVRNNWSWKQEFVGSTINYTSFVTGAYAQQGKLSNKLYQFALSGAM